MYVLAFVLAIFNRLVVAFCLPLLRGPGTGSGDDGVDFITAWGSPPLESTGEFTGNFGSALKPSFSSVTFSRSGRSSMRRK